jgi:iron complex outermembrane receptor protein
LTPVPGATTTDCARSVSGVGGANPDLKPETSKSFTLGMILSPADHTDILIDAYRVRQRSEVALGSADLLLRNPGRFPADYITRDENPANQLVDASGKPIAGTGPLLAVKLPWTNQGSTEVTGIDYEVRNRLRLDSGNRLTTTFRVTHLLDFRRAEQPGDVTHDAVGTNGGLNDWATSLGSIARIRYNLRLVYDTGAHTFSGGLRYVSSISLLRRYDNEVVYPEPYCHYGTGQPRTAYSLGGLPGYSALYPGCAVPSWQTVDLGYSYAGIKNAVLSLSVSNATNVKAPFYPGFTNQAHNASLHNAVGRAFRVSARYNF